MEYRILTIERKRGKVEGEYVINLSVLKFDVRRMLQIGVLPSVSNLNRKVFLINPPRYSVFFLC